MVVNLYRSPNAYTAVSVVELGEITSGASSYNEAASTINNCDVVVYLNDYMDLPSGSILNYLSEGQDKLYASNDTLQNYFYLDDYWDNTVGWRYYTMFMNGATNMAGIIPSFTGTPYAASKVYLATATVNGVVYLGFLVINDRDPASPGYRRWNVFCANSTWSATMLSEIHIIGGGVESDAINNPIGGDDYANYDFEGDDIELPTAPDETVSGVLASGFLNIYKPSDSQLRDFGAALWTNAFNVKWTDIDSVSNLVLNAVSNPIDFIIGLFMLPVTPDSGNASGIFLGGINVNTISAPRVTSQYKTIDFGTINIDELYANYLDYSNSRVSIYLPYVGTADIDVQEINGGSIHLQYIVDCFTGACVANVQCVKVTNAPWGVAYANKTVHSYSGNMAIQLPISAGSFDTLTQGLINVGLGLGTNTPAIAMTGAKDVMQGFAGDVTTRGSLSSNTGKLGYQTPYLMFTRPIESRPANLGELHGYSAGVGGILSQFSGYVECSDVKLDGITATDNELNEIESILKSGVYV